MFRGEGDREEAWPEDAALRSHGGSAAASGSSRSMVGGGVSASEGEGMEQGEAANDGGSVWIVMAGKEHASGEFKSPFPRFVNGCSRFMSLESTGSNFE